jgi:hypothetical protein
MLDLLWLSKGDARSTIIGFLRGSVMVDSRIRSMGKSVALLCLLASTAAASADIYIWTDERGTTVISDKRPADPRTLKNFEVVVNDSDRPARKGSGPREATRTEQALLDRIDNLERQLRTPSYSAPPAPSPAPAVVYSTSPPAPAYDPYYSPFLNNYPSYYSPFSYVVPGAVVVRRGFGQRHVNRGFAGRGRR